jgi:mRNA interferase HigB
VHVVTHARIVAAQARFPESAGALDFWYRAMRHGRFTTFAELRAAFGSVDKVEHEFVFNVGGNKLRVIAAVHFNAGKVFVRHVLSHAEDDRGAWKRREGIQ